MGALGPSPGDAGNPMRFRKLPFPRQMGNAVVELDNSEFQPDDAMYRAQLFHIHLIWFPYNLISTGIEAMWGERENFGGTSGTATRIQRMATYLFN